MRVSSLVLKSKEPVLTILLIIVLLQVSWLMYYNIASVESAEAHFYGAKWPTSCLGIVAFFETIGLFKALAKKASGLPIIAIAEPLRIILMLFADSPIIRSPIVFLFTVLQAGLLFYLLSFEDSAAASNNSKTASPRGTIYSKPQEDAISAPRVFLSYSRKQFYFAESLMLRLTYRSIPVWFDAQNIRAGNDWQQSIDQGLSVSDSLIVLASRSSLASKTVEYEWRTAQREDKSIYVVIFETVTLPMDLQENAIAIIDMRTRFEAKAKKLADLLYHPRFYREKSSTAFGLRRLVRIPSSLAFIISVLLLILLTSVFFAIFDTQVLATIGRPNSSDIPETIEADFTAHLFGFTFHGHDGTVYVLLGTYFSIIILIVLCSYLLLALVRRRRVIFSLISAVLLGPSLLFFNASFLQNTTNRIVVTASDRLITTPASYHATPSNVWSDFLSTLFPGDFSDSPGSFSSPGSVQYASSYLSVGPKRMYFSRIAEYLHWPTFLLLVFSVAAFWAARRSGALFRWLATGVATDRMRLLHNLDWLKQSNQIMRPSSKESSWIIFHHQLDSHIAEEIRAELNKYPSLLSAISAKPDFTIIILTRNTELAWLEEVEKKRPSNPIYVLCSNIRLEKTLMPLRRHQWFDYRDRSQDRLTLLAGSIVPGSPTGTSYIFPAIPETMEKNILPSVIWYKSHAMKIFATWSLAVILFGGGVIDNDQLREMRSFLGIISKPLVTLLYWVSIPCCLYLFLLASQLGASSISYSTFRRRLNLIMTVLWTAHLQFFGYFADQFSLSMLWVAINVFLAIAWFTPDISGVQSWFPQIESSKQIARSTLTISLWRQSRFSAWAYLILFVFFYLTSSVFFADVAYVR
jgi:TIR domain